MQVGTEEHDKAGEEPSPMSTDDTNAELGTSRRLLESYEPLPYGLVEAEIVLCQQVRESMNHLWEEESQKYEQTMKMRVDGKTLTVPRRNYLNESGVVEDETLFPYHTACYPLLDAYDCLYEENQSQQPISAKAVRPFPFVPPFERQDYGEGYVDVQGFMPSSKEAIVESLVHKAGYGDRGVDIDEFWNYLNVTIFRHEEICCADNFLINPFFVAARLRSNDEAVAWYEYASNCLELESTREPYGPLHLPHDRDERATILLKLVRHSLSELQRDYKLAAAALTLMIRFRDLDDLHVFRRLLAVFASEFAGCDRPCEHDGIPHDHHCLEWREIYYRLLTKLFSVGVSWFTQDHALCLAGFVRSTFLREFGLFATNPTEECVAGKRKRLLKRAVVALRAEDDENVVGRGDLAGGIPVEFIEALVVYLGERGTIDRNRVLNLHGEHNDVGKDWICMCLDSYHNCIRALVFIAESIVQLLPESEIFFNIASALVLSLCRCLVRHDLFGNDERRYFGLENSALQDNRLISPLRYASCITGSTEAKLHRLVRRRNIVQYLESNADPTTSVLQKFEMMFDYEPPNEVLTVVRGLFLKNLVDVRYSGLGYGDFLLWCRYEICPLDPLLFWNEYAYPDEEQEEDSDDEDQLDEEDRPSDWDSDEDEHALTVGEIAARHAFTLLLLQRAWQAPWLPETHASFQPGFRDAVKTVALCTHKLGFPHETMLTICAFLSRDWWEDSRKQCWCYECRYECRYDQAGKAIEHQLSNHNSIDSKTDALEYCPHCRVAMYCSKECRDKDYKVGHKKMCCRPPLQSTVPDKVELQLCVDILKDDATSLPKFLTSRNTESVDIVRQAFAAPGSTDEHNSGGDMAVDSMADDDLMDDDAGGDDDDDGSWETVESGDEGTKEAEGSTISKTARIYKYFKEAYK